jgi:hypothetical protein
MQAQELLEYLDIPFSFYERPTPLQPQLRIVWGLSILVLILELCSRGKSSSVSRLHLLNWSIRNSKNRDLIIEFIENRLSPLTTLIQYDPGFNRAIEYALEESLIEMRNSNSKIFLTPNGGKMAKEIIALDNCFEEEKNFLREKGAFITETLAKSLLKST